MLIIPYVCAEFHDFSGNLVFRITPAMRGTMVEAPEAIKQDILFDMLVNDGSIKVPETAAQKKALENDPNGLLKLGSVLLPSPYSVDELRVLTPQDFIDQSQS